MCAAMFSHAKSFSVSTETAEQATQMGLWDFRRKPEKLSCSSTSGAQQEHSPLYRGQIGPKSRSALGEVGADKSWISRLGVYFLQTFLVTLTMANRESSACQAMPELGLLREMGMFARSGLRPSINVEQAAFSVYFKALLAQFKPCLSW